MVTTTLANGFVKRGHSVSIVSFVQLVPELLGQLDNRVIFHSMSHPFARKENRNRLHQILVDESTDFILNQWCLPFYVTRFCRAAMKGTHCRLLAVHHNPPDQNARVNDVKIKLDTAKSGFQKLYFKLRLIVENVVTIASMRYVYRYSHRYVVLSESFIDLFKNYTRLPNAAKLSVIGNPLTINADGFAYDFQEKEKVILYVGRIDHIQKRVERIVEVWKSLAVKLPDWKLEIVGDGPERKRLEAMVLRDSIPRVSFEGFQDTADYYKRASILLLTSEYEGFGLVIVEAMAFACVPVVYGSYSAVYDIIENGKDGYIVPTPFDPGCYSSYVEALAQDGEKRHALSKAAVRSAENFSLNSVLLRWERLLEKNK